MELIAMISMLIDHIGITFFPEQDSFRMIGRLAFPIYAYALVQGYRYTRSRKKYALRLLIIAVCAQLPYTLLFHTFELNIVFSLSLALGCLILLDRFRQAESYTAILVALAAIMIAELLPFEYGAYGLLLVCAYRYLSGMPLIAAHLALNIMELVIGIPLQMYSILPTIVIALTSEAWWNKRTVPRWLWRSFYPLHLFVLAGVVYLIE